MKFIKEEHSPWYKRVLFHWVSPLISVGSREHISDQHLFELNSREDSAQRGEEFFSSLKSMQHSLNHPVLRTMWSLHKKTFYFISALAFVNLVFVTMNPLIIREVLKALKSTEPVGAKGWLLSGALMCSALLANLTIHHVYHSSLKLGMRIRAGLVVSIYKKALQLNPASRASSSTGEIVNLMANDAARVYNVASMLHSAWVLPVQTLVILIALFNIMGSATLAGVAVMFVMLWFSSRRAKKMMSGRRRLMEFSDQRVSLMNEILNGIRVIKFYAWEKSFIGRVRKFRTQELTELGGLARESAFVNILFLSTPIFVGLATFSAHLAIGGTLHVEDVFTALAFFGILRPIMSQLPMTFSGYIDAGIAVRRIEAFLMRDEFPVRKFQSEIGCGEIHIRAGTVEWAPGKSSLILPEIKIRAGELVVILGPVGSGKSTFLHSILNELNNSDQLIESSGRFAFVPQLPWILNGTVRENIQLSDFEKPHVYRNAIAASSLEDDLSQLALGDETEIGERGVNLSGGQKQRIALARAVFSEADIYLLDSPLSAVDSKVGKEIFRDCLRGLLSNKTRLLITHNVEHTAWADRVLWIQDGRIRELSTTEIEALRKSQTLQTAEPSLSTPGLSPEPLPGEASSVNSLSTSKEQTFKMATTVPMTAHPAQSPARIHNPSAGRLVVDEERQVGAVERALYSNYLKELAPGKALTILATLFVLREVFNAGSDSWLAWWTTHKSQSISVFLFVLALLGAAAALMTFLRTLMTARGGVKAAGSLHERLLEGVLKAPMSFFEKTPTGRILNRFGKDTEAIDQHIPSTLMEALGCLFTIGATLTFVSLATPVALLALFPLAFVYLKIQHLFRVTSREVKRLESISRSPVYAHFSESLAGVSVIRAFDCTQIFVRESIRRFEGNQRAFYTMISLNRWLGTRLEFIGALVVGCASASAILLQGQITTAFAGVSLTYALLVTGALNWAVRMVSELESSMNAIERVNHYSETQSEKWEGQSPHAAWPSAGNIEFRQLTLRYRPELPPVLERVSLHIKAGESIGIVGRTGAGKSTLMQTLFRIVEPPVGTVFVDDIDITTLPLETLRSRIAIIPQDPILFSGTFRQNVDPFDQYSDTDVLYALERSHLSQVLESLPQGLQTIVQEGGCNLSVGQRQQVCLARALLRKARVLLLDEATANVDSHTDSLIQATIQSEFSGCTILTIAHRLNTVMHCDRIVVMQSGRIVECESPSRLMADKRGVFAGYWADSRLELPAH
jgi:ABC-type multidrug transport system fused ATPase/permease subunit